MTKMTPRRVDSPALESDELAQLKQLLFAEEAATLDVLRHHVLDARQRTEDVAAILPASIKGAAVDKSRLAEALNDSVDDCIRSLMQKDPQHFADALFPVIGPAIRKAIAETLRSFLQSMNQMVEQSMSAKALRWRWEARRSGVAFSEIVLKYSLLYRVDEVYLIQQRTGLLIDHISHPDVEERDSDAISAMLTVIRDFSRDSFSARANDTLSTVEIGDRTLWMFDGPVGLLACVIRGVIPESMRPDFQAVLEKLHTEYADDLEHFDGDRSGFVDVHPMLADCLKQQVRPEESQTAGTRRHFLLSPTAGFLFLALCLGGYLIWQHHVESQRIALLRTDLEMTPGVVVLTVRRDGGKVMVDGLIDPIAAPLNEIAKKHGIRKDDIRFDMSFYHSLDTPIALERARRLLQPPDTVNLKADHAELVAVGVAPQKWIRRAETLRLSIPGFDRIDLTGVKVDQQAELERLHNLLNPPESVELGLINRQLHVSGIAPFEWIKEIRKKITNQQRLDPIRIGKWNRLIAREWLQASTVLDTLNGTKVYFSRGTGLTSVGQRTMRRVSVDLSTLQEYAAQLDTEVNVVLTGHTDGTGRDSLNEAIRIQRAEAVRRRLADNSLANLSIQVKAGDSAATTRQPDQALRRVDISAAIRKPEWAEMN